MNKVTENVFQIGINDYKTDLFEGQYPLPKGIAYNSYVIIDEKTAVLDT
ncbi:MAG TPA: FprA family A-type flavoprotein, partial [Acholeplasmataceae bacterium]|nr:FprA family A-type flavoprotein [Acholeplasmataceae bacterium]